MKKNNLILVFSVVLLTLLLTQSACNHSPNEIAFEQNEQIYVIDKESSGVTIFTNEGVLIDSIGAPSAGADTFEFTSLPPEIIRLLLLSKGSIGNLVWDDDGNGIYDPGEPGVEGVRVFVDLNDDQLFSSEEPSSITDVNGKYEIKNLRPATYTVTVDSSTLPAGYFIITNHPLSVPVVKKSKYENADFGIQNRSASVDGYVWNDSDADGNINNSEAPIPGVNIYVDLNNDDEFTLGEPLATTDSNGYYQIQQLQAGTFKVHVDNGTLPVIYLRIPVSGSNPATVTLTKNQPSTVSFGYLKKVSIRGTLRDNNGNTWGNVTLFIDLNGNGVYDKGEPITKTDIYGSYMFDNLYPGTYTIMVMSNQLPGGYDYTLLSITLGEGINHTVDLLLQTQSKFSAVNTLRAPTRLSWGSNGNLYVSDNSLGSVFIFDPTLALLNELKGLNKPLGVNTDASGNIYVGVQGSKSVIKYDTLGNYLKTIGKGNIDTPNDITFDADGNLYVLDSANDVVHVFDPAGSLIRTIGNSTQLKYAVSIAIHGGELYVADLYKKQVVVFSLQGSLLRAIGGPATAGSMMNFNGPLDWEGFFVGLKAIDFDQTGTLHALDSSLNVVSRFNPVTGEYLGYYNAYDPANDTKLNLQNDISINGLGEVIQANAANRRVEYIIP